MTKVMALQIPTVAACVNLIADRIVQAIEAESTAASQAIDENTDDLGFISLDKAKLVSAESGEKGVKYAYRTSEMKVRTVITDGITISCLDLFRSGNKLNVKLMGGDASLIPNVNISAAVTADSEMLSALESYGITEDSGWTLPEDISGYDTDDKKAELTALAASQSTCAFIGSCGEGNSGELSGSGTLTITGNGVIDFQEFPFVSEDLRTLVIEEGITGIDSNVFSQCQKLRNVSLPSTLKTIGDSVFENCSQLKSITIPEGTESIGERAFGNCSNLKYVVLPSTIKDIGSYTFDQCLLLIYAELAEGIESIPEGMFMRCASLSDIIIPETVNSIGANAFGGCYALGNIIVPSSVTAIGENAFYESAVIICDSSSYAAEYAEANGFTAEYFESDVTSGSPVVSTFNCGEGVFCKQLSNGTFVICGNGEMTDAESAEASPFYSKRDEIIKVIICEGVTSVGNYSFSGCENLTSVSCPDSLRKIGEHAFSNCPELNGFWLPEGLESIGNYAFENSSKLGLVEIPKSVTTIGTNPAPFRCWGRCRGWRIRFLIYF